MQLESKAVCFSNCFQPPPGQPGTEAQLQQCERQCGIEGDDYRSAATTVVDSTAHVLIALVALLLFQ